MLKVCPFLAFLFLLSSSTSIVASQSIRFLYDGDGVRVAKIESGKTTLYVGDLEKDLTSGQVTKYYTLGGKRIAVGEKLASQGQALRSYLISDHLGSTRALTNSIGLPIPNSQITYFPYGAVRTNPTAFPSRQYTGQVNDEQTGLYFYNARYYNPQNANFIQADRGGNTMNKYVYVNGNPINYSDPTGNDEEGIDFVSPGNTFPGTGISSSQEINSTILGPITCLNTPEGCTQEQIDQWNTESLSMTGQVSYAAMNVIFIAAAAPSIAVLVEGFIANLPVIGNKAAPEMEQIIANVKQLLVKKYGIVKVKGGLNMCGIGSCMIDYEAKHVGAVSLNFQVILLNAARGIPSKMSAGHAFSLVTNHEGQFVVDLTYMQFVNPATGRMLIDPGWVSKPLPQVGRELLERGYFRYTPEKLTQYLDSLHGLPSSPRLWSVMDKVTGFDWTREYPPAYMQKMMGR